MKVRNSFIIAMALFVLAFAFVDQASAQRNILGKVFGKKKQTIASLELTENVGPWVIMCYSFSGEDGAQQAKRLAEELRSNYRLNAYTYTHRTDLTQKIRQHALVGKKLVRDEAGEVLLGADGKPVMVDENLVAASNMNKVETAVVVGSYSSLDDEHAQRQLREIKSIAPKSLAGGRDSVRSQTNRLNGGRAFSQDSLFASSTSLRQAFLMPNPMLSEEYFNAISVDKFVIDMNKNVKYSLLKCPGRYSVRVATFRGKTIISAAEMKKQMDDFSWRKSKGKAMESELDKCMDKARALTKALRKQGVKAWEFHDREESYVCVGSFDWLKKTDVAGNEIQNPLVRQEIKKYKGSVSYKDGYPVAIGKPVPKSLRHLKDGDAIAYDVQPLPVICPKAPQSRSAGIMSKLGIRR